MSGSLNKEKIKELIIRIPSLENQQNIVNYLDERMKYHTNYWKTLFSFNLNDYLEKRLRKNYSSSLALPLFFAITSSAILFGAGL